MKIIRKVFGQTILYYNTIKIITIIITRVGGGNHWTTQPLSPPSTALWSSLTAVCVSGRQGHFLCCLHTCVFLSGHHLPLLLLLGIPTRAWRVLLSCLHSQSHFHTPITTAFLFGRCQRGQPLVSSFHTTDSSSRIQVLQTLVSFRTESSI